MSDGKSTESFHKAARNGDVETASKLLNEGLAIDETDRDGWTALFHAVSNGQLSAAQFLVEKGANVNVTNNDDRPLLFEAIAEGKKEVIHFLFEKGADYKINLKSGGVLHECIEWDNVELLKYFLEKNVDINVKGKKGNTPLHEAAKVNRKDMVEALLAKGANVNARNKHDLTPLHLLIESSDSHKIKDTLIALVHAGSNVNEVDDVGNTFLHRICSGDLELVDTVKIRSLLEVGADPQIKNSQGETPEDLLELEEDSTKVKEIVAKYLRKGHNQEQVTGFRLIVQTMGGSAYIIELPSSECTVRELKEAINRIEDVPPERNMLKYKKKIALDNDSKRLSEYGIDNEDAVLSILVKKNY
eukprot:TRINITY_DN6007_c0_g1_i1.p1 TRINITY_DN6007_c0_g1~~TRINITY_DN6007_c0_g1_i1.p1  ORF type:complete len:367 (-),score=82.63 TRINITY_DN6007_c0_g1_i1:213-1289(-)